MISHAVLAKAMSSFYFVAENVELAGGPSLRAKLDARVRLQQPVKTSYQSIRD